MRFLRPDLASWFLVVPVVVACWLIQYGYATAMRRRSAAEARFAPLSRRSTWKRSAALCLASVVASGAAAFALVRPQVSVTTRLPEYERQDLIIVLDRSASMRAHDIMPSRFARATAEIRTFLRQKPDVIDRVGMIGFADAAVVLSYPTSDLNNLLFYLDWIDSESTPLFGTNIGAALGSARAMIKKDDRPTRKTVVVMSDGEDFGAELQSAIAAFRADGVRIHCIGIGSNDQVTIPLPLPDGTEAPMRDEGGRLVRTQFSETTLRDLAESTGGLYARSTTGAEMSAAITRIVDSERKLVGWKQATDYRDLYPAALGTSVLAGAALWLAF
jgi:Ca-activated chloride channel homolog